MEARRKVPVDWGPSLNSKRLLSNLPRGCSHRPTRGLKSVDRENIHEDLSGEPRNFIAMLLVSQFMHLRPTRWKLVGTFSLLHWLRFSGSCHSSVQSTVSVPLGALFPGGLELQ